MLEVYNAVLQQLENIDLKYKKQSVYLFTNKILPNRRIYESI
jgi:hypothetical protein